MICKSVKSIQVHSASRPLENLQKVHLRAPAGWMKCKFGKPLKTCKLPVNTAAKSANAVKSGHLDAAFVFHEESVLILHCQMKKLFKFSILKKNLNISPGSIVITIIIIICINNNYTIHGIITPDLTCLIFTECVMIQSFICISVSLLKSHQQVRKVRFTEHVPLITDLIFMYKKTNLAGFHIWSICSKHHSEGLRNLLN